MTVGPLIRMAQTLDGGRLIVEEEFCVNSRARRAFCNRCIKACPADALDVSEDGIELDESVCTACGGCAPACPAGALRMAGFEPEAFIASLNGAAEVHLSCTVIESPPEYATIRCYLMLDRRLAAAAFAEGTRRFVLHGTEQCATCHRADARNHLTRLAHSMAKWFGDRGPEFSITATDHTQRDGCFDTSGYRTGRRNFLRFMGVHAGSGVAQFLTTTRDDPDNQVLGSYTTHEYAGSLPKRPVDYRTVLARRLTHLPWAKQRRLPWHTRAIDEACSACMVCADNCPTGALEGSRDDGMRQISFDPAFCTNCTLCQQVCPQDAIRPHLARSAAEATAPRAVLMHRATKQCDLCLAEFVASDTESGLCPVCANEQEMDEEWLEMLRE